MIVVVSAIVDPWVTTFSFVVALAMRIQGQIIQIWRENQAPWRGNLARASKSRLKSEPEKRA